VLLAGVGASQLLRAARSAPTRAAAVALVVAGCAHLGWQAWAGSFRYAADPRNPYVYAHTTTDVFEIARRVEGLALAHPQGLGMPIEVISHENLWPLPWYFRRLTAVRWERAVPESGAPAPLILTTPEMEGAVTRRLYEARPPGERELYMNVFDPPLEPQVEVRAYAAKSLWDRYRESKN
jgi:predicted membrane-bound mannosyltransferase